MEQKKPITQEAFDAIVAENASLKSENEKLKTAHEAAHEQIKKLSNAVVAKEEFVKTKPEPKPTRPKEPVEVGGKEYTFRFAAFYFEGVRYTAEDASVSPEILEKIVATAGQGILIEKA